jgi:NAD(P)H dehydrogenase (quinone)
LGLPAQGGAPLDQSIGTGVLGYAGDDLARLIGHPTMSLTEGLRQNR